MIYRDTILEMAKVLRIALGPCVRLIHQQGGMDEIRIETGCDFYGYG